MPPQIMQYELHDKDSLYSTEDCISPPVCINLCWHEMNTSANSDLLMLTPIEFNPFDQANLDHIRVSGYGVKRFLASLLMLTLVY